MIVEFFLNPVQWYMVLFFLIMCSFGVFVIDLPILLLIVVFAKILMALVLTIFFSILSFPISGRVMDVLDHFLQVKPQTIALFHLRFGRLQRFLPWSAGFNLLI